MEGGDSDFDPAAAKAALEHIRAGLRERGLRRKAPVGEAGSPKSADAETVQEQPVDEEPLPAEDADLAPAPPRRTVLNSFVPQLVRGAMKQYEQPQKRGPGRPRKS